MRQTIILVTIICLLLTSAVPSQATISQKAFALTIFSLGTTGFSALAYYLWKNSPAERMRGYPENLTLGEWYWGGYAGAAILPSQDWTFSKGFNPPLKGLTAQDVSLQPGVTGGMKFGRFFDSLPWLGVELETNFSKHIIKEQNVTLSQPLPSGARNVLIPRDRFYIWCLQTNILARYGFLPTKETPFGRLQPYVGIGPGFEVLYGVTDSAKNFAVETLTGLRFMAAANISIFCEYKFSYQFNAEYERKQIPPDQVGIVSFDVPNHRLVFGFTYHFKNLFGN